MAQHQYLQTSPRQPPTIKILPSFSLHCKSPSAFPAQLKTHLHEAFLDWGCPRSCLFPLNTCGTRTELDRRKQNQNKRKWNVGLDDLRDELSTFPHFPGEEVETWSDRPTASQSVAVWGPRGVVPAWPSPLALGGALSSLGELLTPQGCNWVANQGASHSLWTHDLSWAN